MTTFRLILVSALVCASWNPLTQAGEGFRRGDWPFIPLARPQTPVTRHATWANNGIDSFILAELEKRDLEPSPAADRATLLRRVTFDLTGLPPTVEEIEDFLADDSPEAYEHVVDRLLSSPRFGERWARHWLDVVRFADTAGFRNDFLRRNAYRYRDYVIEAFNDDLPFNRFVQQQIAGDELEPGNPDALVATGMLRLYAEDAVASDISKMRQDILDDVTETAGLTFLGLTLGCAKCHDHKFDPILQTDFYRMQACFAAIVPRDDRPVAEAAELTSYQRQYKVWEDATAEIRRQLDEMDAPCRRDAIEQTTLAYDKETRDAWLTPENQRTTEQNQLVALSDREIGAATRRRIRNLPADVKARYDDLQKQLATFDSLKPPPIATSMAVQEGPGPAPEIHVLDTGDYRKPEESVSAGFPEFLGQSEPELLIELESAASPSQPPRRRSALARWLTLPDHPLTARVMVNRLWQHHFGRGIVETPNDFGNMGQSPTHPKLLDWLASELVERNWSLKSIHRLMVTSATYQQTSLIDEQENKDELAADPGNRFLWRANRVRLDAEPLRDSLLWLSSQLNPAMGGPSGYPVLVAAVRENSGYAWTPDDNPAQHFRRSIYCFQKRNLRLPLLASFDQPDMYISCGVRSNTLTPTQSLAMLNGDDAAEAARRWAGRLLAQSLGSDEHLVKTAWLQVYGRPAEQAEVAAARRFLSEQAQRNYDHDQQLSTRSLPEPCPSCLEPSLAGAYVDFCHALLNSSEFLFVD